MASLRQTHRPAPGDEPESLDTQQLRQLGQELLAVKSSPVDERDTTVCLDARNSTIDPSTDRLTDERPHAARPMASRTSTQESSSPTQENAKWVYDRFRSPERKDADIVIELDPEPGSDPGSGPAARPAAEPDPEPASSSPVRQPHTPFHVNPFKQPGSVMAASQLFWATQPTPVPQLASSVSRPSPVYHTFHSPAGVSSSPLGRQTLSSPAKAPPDQPALRRNPSNAYITVNESQKRRTKELPESQDWYTDLERTAREKRRRRLIDEAALQELSTVQIPAASRIIRDSQEAHPEPHGSSQSSGNERGSEYLANRADSDTSVSDDELPEPAPKRRRRDTPAASGDTPIPETSPPGQEYFGNMLLHSSMSEATPQTIPQTPCMGPPEPRQAKRTRRQKSGLFATMAFGVSYVDHDDEKRKVVQLIKSHGGRLLQDGFEELFINDTFDCLSSEPAVLNLTAAARDSGFVCLIADRHSRRAKYMQALALNLPCLSGKWILDCVRKSTLLKFTPYLLCAGDSTFLGTCCGRTILPYPPATARFETTFASREKLMDGKSILFVMRKGREKTRRAYAFLTLALGAARIQRVVSIESARKTLSADATWDWIYTDHDEARRGRKAESNIINDEYVIQSLIIGALFD